MSKNIQNYDSSQENPQLRSKPHPIRVNEPGHVHFVTTSCYDKKPFLSKDWTRQLVLDAIDRARSKKGFFVVGYVIMPEHVHLLLVPPKGCTISQIMGYLKWYSSVKLLAVLRKKGMNERILWQSRFYDFNVYTQPKLIEKLNYCHHNPVKRGLVESPEEWQHSSYRNYEKDDDRIFRIDRWWCC